MCSMTSINLITALPKCLIMTLVNDWIEEPELVELDSAFCSVELRDTFLYAIQGCKLSGLWDVYTNYDEYLDWVALRNMTCRAFAMESENVMMNSTLLALMSQTSHLKRLEAICCLELLNIFKLCNSCESLKLTGSQASAVPMLNALLKSLINLQELSLSNFNGDNLDEIRIPSLKRIECDSVELANVLTVQCSHCETYSGPIRTVLPWLSNMPTLTSLTTNDAAHIKDSDMILIAGSCPRLTSLVLSDKTMIDELSDTCIVCLVKQCTGLQTLHLSKIVDLSDISGTAIGQNCPQLTELDLSGTSIGNLGLKSVALGCPCLRHLHLYSCNEVSDEAIVYLAQYCRQLETLNIKNTSVFGSTVTLLMANNTLNFFHHHQADVVLSVLLLFLRQAVLFYCMEDKEKYSVCRVEAMGGQHVHYSSSQLGKSTFMAVLSPSLLYLHVSGSISFDDDCIEYVVMHCSHLAEITLVDCLQLTNACLLSIAKCSRLRCLEINRLRDLTDAMIITVIEAQPNLEKLWLADCCDFTDATVDCIAIKCPDIKSVDFSGNKVLSTTAVVHLLISCKRIFSLKVAECPRIDSSVLRCLEQRQIRMRLVDVTGCPLIAREECDRFVSRLGKGHEHILKFQ